VPGPVLIHGGSCVYSTGKETSFRERRPVGRDRCSCRRSLSASFVRFGVNSARSRQIGAVFCFCPFFPLQGGGTFSRANC